MKKLCTLFLCGILYAATGNAQIVDSGTTGDCTWTITGMEDFDNSSNSPPYHEFLNLEPQ